jgi:enamine deaminase RidA (YjgF/YER057c/UK114 family)
MDIQTCLKSLANGAGGFVAETIAHAIGDAADIDLLKDKNAQIVSALKSIGHQLDTLTGTITQAIRTEQITAARDKIYNTMDTITDSFEVEYHRIFSFTYLRVLSTAKPAADGLNRTKTQASTPKQSSL